MLKVTWLRTIQDPRTRLKLGLANCSPLPISSRRSNRVTESRTLSRNGATFCVLPDPFQGVRGGINFSRSPRRLLHSLRTRVGSTPTRCTVDAGNLFLVLIPSLPTSGWRCAKCDARMDLTRVARGSSNFDIRTFDCPKCDDTHIVTVATDLIS